MYRMLTCMLACSGVNRQNHSISKSAIKVRTSGGVLLKPEKCIGCKRCVEPLEEGMRALPVKNLNQIRFENVGDISGEAFVRKIS